MKSYLTFKYSNSDISVFCLGWESKALYKSKKEKYFYSFWKKCTEGRLYKSLFKHIEK